MAESGPNEIDQVGSLKKIRIIQKHETAENWAKATGFNPYQGELVVYDAVKPQIKIGNGKSANINDLPFLQEGFISEVEEANTKFVKLDQNLQTSFLIPTKETFEIKADKTDTYWTTF